MMISMIMMTTLSCFCNQHFDPLHGQMTFPFTTVAMPGTIHHHHHHDHREREAKSCRINKFLTLGITVNHRPKWEQGKDDKKHLCW